MSDLLTNKDIPVEELERITRLLTSATFQFAKTAKHNPHYYTLRRTWADDADFNYIVEAIRRYGYREKFGSTWYMMLNVGACKYWTMGAHVRETTLINRKPILGVYSYEEELTKQPAKQAKA